MTLAKVVVERPKEDTKHQCRDKEYDNPAGNQAASAHGYRGHVMGIGEGKLDSQVVKRHPAR